MKITLRRPDDWHLHLRDGAMMRAVLPYSARVFGRAMIMPNLTPPVSTAAAARAYRQRILAALPPQSSFHPLMTCYLTDDLSAAELRAGAEQGIFAAAKLYPAGATTHSARGVTALRKIWPLLEMMQEIDLPLLVHGEVVDAEVDIFDREAVFIERTLAPLLRDFPALRVVQEHVSSAAGVAFVQAQGQRMAATITPHHLTLTRTDLLAGGVHPHYYCLPVIKGSEDRRALQRAATSGSPRFFLGTDSAPHPVRDKESARGRAGIFNSPTALTIVTQVFEEEGALDALERFVSLNGARFYGLPINNDSITLVSGPPDIPTEIAVPELNTYIHIFLPFQFLRWQIVDELASDSN
ncbi:MAG: dihydroorotase [Clostridia bacterium]|nr:MAG: dihydroorotase [Clostridia bacterium]